MGLEPLVMVPSAEKSARRVNRPPDLRCDRFHRTRHVADRVAFSLLCARGTSASKIANKLQSSNDY